MSTAPLRRGPAEILLGDFVRRHHLEVEPIRSAVWGWSQNNDVGNSNHLAGTAVDVLAPWRPWGALVLSQTIINKTYALLDTYKVDGQRGIFWGREWNRHDEMHFQLAWPEGDRRYDVLIARVRGGVVTPGNPTVPVVPTPNMSPILQYGSFGTPVSELQSDMNRIFKSYPQMPLEVDGEFGPNTMSAVIEFQRRTKLLADGIVGPLTWAEFAKYGVKL
jgi:peptidoglycan hydrolase-like protein with peptidoglycan-binding domain